ncbi:MAG TPA: hypothetical protein PLA90_07050 [Candidatus Sumerlaeota bacterium]|nr:hypothetical protein [Candidatus Sumerlaeota bacterium]
MSAFFRSRPDRGSRVFESRLRSLTHRYVPVLTFLLALLGLFLLSRDFFREVGVPVRGHGGHATGTHRVGGKVGAWLQPGRMDASGEMVYADPASETVDGFLHFSISKGEQSLANVHALFRRYCNRAQLVSQRFQENGVTEIAYRLVLSDPSYSDDLVEQLESLSGISQITFMLHEEQAEV